jgi:hypothetical protein
MLKDVKRWQIYIGFGVFLMASGPLLAIQGRPDVAPITVGAFTNAVVLPFALANLVKLLIFVGIGLIVAGVLERQRVK